MRKSQVGVDDVAKLMWKVEERVRLSLNGKVFCVLHAVSLGYFVVQSVLSGIRSNVKLEWQRRVPGPRH